ncbi:MAG: hypothetical protein R2715_18545 [Ilumatobacteraceae bacterium]
MTDLERSIRNANVDKDWRVAPIIAELDAAKREKKNLESQLASLNNSGRLQGIVTMHAGTSGIGGSIKVEQCNGTRCAPLAGARLVITPTPQACVTLAPLPEACVKALNSDQSIIEMRRRRFSRRRRRVRFAVVLDGEGRLRRALDVPHAGATLGTVDCAVADAHRSVPRQRGSGRATRRIVSKR